MRMLLVFAFIGWIISLPWAYLLAYFALIVVAIVIMWLLSAAIERHPISPRPKSRTIDHNYVTALESMVVEAEAEVEKLRSEIERLRLPAASEPDPKAALFRRVGLNESAPDWLISAARRAYRVALHPDKHPVHWKQEAERRLKMAEGVFDQIAARS